MMPESTETPEAVAAETPVPEKTSDSDEGESPMDDTDAVQLFGLNDNDIRLVDLLVAEKGPDENVFVSPLSLDLALGMLYNAADGETKERMRAYLSDDLDAFNQKALSVLENSSRDLPAEDAGVDGDEIERLTEPETIYTICNGLWYDNPLQVNGDYVEQLRAEYMAEIAAMDFKDPASANAINDWCSKKTNGLIPEIVSSDLLRRSVAILANSIYFKGAWVESFGDAKPGVFTKSSGEAVDAQMMHGMAAGYSENEKAYAVSKYYYGGFRFVGILPKEPGDFELSDLDIPGLLTGSDEHPNCDVMLTLPKLNLSFDAELNEALTTMGLGDIFKDSANFSKMSDDLAVSEVLQKTVLKLDENGTEAAAVTVVSVRCTAAMPEVKEIVEFVFDRPFALVIQDPNGNVLFVGKIVDPTM